MLALLRASGLSNIKSASDNQMLGWIRKDIQGLFPEAQDVPSQLLVEHLCRVCYDYYRVVVFKKSPNRSGSKPEVEVIKPGEESAGGDEAWRHIEAAEDGEVYEAGMDQATLARAEILRKQIMQLLKDLKEITGGKK